MLALVNAVLLPALTRLLVRHGWQRNMRGRAAAALNTRLLLMARLLTTIVIPVGAVLLLAEGCGGRWKSMWVACHGNNTFASYNETAGCTGRGCQYYIASGTVGSPAALTARQLCTANDNTGLASERCVRNAIEALAPLFAEKMAIAAFLQPACLLGESRLNQVKKNYSPFY